MAGTIITVQTKFNNPNLRRITPASVDGILRDGLVGAWRPYGSPGSVMDLSGNAYATQSGSPSFDAVSLIGNGNSGNNGFQTTVQETKNITHVAVCKPRLGSNGAWGVASPYFRNVCSTHNRDTTSSTGDCGSGIYYSITTSGTTYSFNVNMEAGYWNTSTNQYSILGRSAVVYSTTSANLSDITEAQIPWVWAAVSIDGDNEKVLMAAPGMGFSFTDQNNANYKYGQRRLTIPKTGDPCTIPLAMPMLNSDWVTATSTVAVAEILTFNRALSMDDINTQYNLSRSWMAANRGISI